jgi:hypothetical protein
MTNCMVAENFYPLFFNLLFLGAEMSAQHPAKPIENDFVENQILQILIQNNLK